MSNKVKVPRNPEEKPAKVQPIIQQEETVEVQVKRVLLSKTIWINLLAFIAFWIQREYGFILSEDLQMQALTLINIALRFLTKEPIAWGGTTTVSGETSGNNQENS